MWLSDAFKSGCTRLPTGKGVNEDTKSKAGLNQAIGETNYAEHFDRDYDVVRVPPGYGCNISTLIVPDRTHPMPD